jgi:hypothetical protein
MLYGIRIEEQITTYRPKTKGHNKIKFTYPRQNYTARYNLQLKYRTV